MRFAALILVLLSVACQPGADPAEAGEPTIVVMDDIEAGMPLDSMLALLDQQLAAAHEGQLEGSALDAYHVAEAISDRLLEARMPFEWIAAEDYSIQSRLRQIQSAADRVLAQTQASFEREVVLNDLRILRDDVADLRSSIAAGGTRAPPTIEALLGDTVGSGRQPAQPATTQAPRRSGPLGTPVQPPAR